MWLLGKPFRFSSKAVDLERFSRGPRAATTKAQQRVACKKILPWQGQPFAGGHSCKRQLLPEQEERQVQPSSPFCAHQSEHRASRRPCSASAGSYAKYMRWSYHLFRLSAGTRGRRRAPYAGTLSRWTKSFKNFFKSLTQLMSRLGVIRGLTSLIRKLDRVRILPGPNSDLHCGYHARANFLGLNGYHAASFFHANT